MKGALTRLLTGVIDYAGLFPPAKLGMAEAIENYLQYIHGPEKWLVSRFVCSSARLPELARELAEHPDEPFAPVTVIGHASSDRRSWEHALAHDADAMNRFMEESDGHAEVQAFEIRVPDHEHLEGYAKDLNGFDDVDVYVELPWDPAVPDSLALLAETQWLGAKGRTGGVEAASFPNCSDLALFLQQCLQLDVPFKLTAGLHHPIRHYNEEVGAEMHGFLNVLTALAIMQGQDVSLREVTAMLADDSGANFRFEEDSVSWRNLNASADDCEAVREVFVSYGSCSVIEPIEDLQRLGLMERVAV